MKIGIDEVNNEATRGNLTERTYMRLSVEEKKELARRAYELGFGGESSYLRYIYLNSKKGEK